MVYQPNASLTMDPTALLEEIRDLIEKEEIRRDGSHAREACEKFRTLDTWLSNQVTDLPFDWDLRE